MKFAYQYQPAAWGDAARARPGGAEENRELSPPVMATSWPAARERAPGPDGTQAPQSFHASGNALNPVADQVFVQLNPIPAGLYLVEARYGFAEVMEAATINNVELRRDGRSLFRLLAPTVLAQDNTWSQHFHVRVDGAETLTLNVAAAGSAGVRYIGSLTAKRLGN